MGTGISEASKRVPIFSRAFVTQGGKSYDRNPSGTAWQAPSYVDSVGIGAYVEFG